MLNGPMDQDEEAMILSEGLLRIGQQNDKGTVNDKIETLTRKETKDSTNG